MKGHAQVVAAVSLYLAVGAAMAAEPLPGTGKAAGDVGPARASGIVVRGNDRLSGSAAATAEQPPGGMASLNLVEVPIPVTAKAVLTDTLGWGYTLDVETHGTLTLQTGGR